MSHFPTITLITEEELDLNDLVKQIVSSSNGAVAMFTRLVRGVTRREDPHETEYLEYEAYQPMAEAMMKQVVDEIRSHWSSMEGIAIVQRIGHLFPCTPTVFIACASAHRDTGVFDAARYGIDRLKQIVPVWKKEVGPNGQEWVEGDHVPTALDAGHNVLQTQR
jgi:molybdopterin synthase catalytic subunit